ncbi:MAG: cupin [Thainema sp.]
MPNTNWLITNTGESHAFSVSDDADNILEIDRPYRLYRFLTDVENILYAEADDWVRLQRICPLVRRLLNSSWWLQGEYKEPNPQTGWSVKFLYEEPDFPLTVQTVVWLPGQVSSIHNHGALGIVALIDGQEKNQLWRRVGDPDYCDRIEPVGDLVLEPGDIIGLMPDAIHHVEVMSEQPTISFNLYGPTNYDQRYEFDVKQHTAKQF